MRRRSLRRLATILFEAVLITGICFAANTFAEEGIKAGGVGSALGTMKLIAQAFEKANPGIKVEIVPGLGSNGGIKALISGAIDIGLSGRPLHADEKAQGAVGTKYAETPLVFITTNRSISGLTTKELIEIYEGKKQTWPDGRQIRLVIRPEKDSDTDVLNGISPEMRQAAKTALSREGMIKAITDQENIDKIVKTPDSLGATTLTQLISEKVTARALSFNGIKPGIKAAADGSYPLSKPLYVVTMAKTSEPAQKLISFIFSPAGRKILSANGNLVSERQTVK